MASRLTSLNYVVSYFAKCNEHDNEEVTDHEMNNDKCVKDYEVEDSEIYLCSTCNRYINIVWFNVDHQMCILLLCNVITTR